MQEQRSQPDDRPGDQRAAAEGEGERQQHQHRCRRRDTLAALEAVSERWSLTVVRHLASGLHRFTDLAWLTGAPRDVLTSRLPALEDEGLRVPSPVGQRQARAVRADPEGLDLAEVDVDGFDELLVELAQLATEVVGPTSCGITVRYKGQLLTVGPSDARAEMLDETQYRASGGPCLEVPQTARIVEILDTGRESPLGAAPAHRSRRRLPAVDVVLPERDDVPRVEGDDR